MRTISLLFILLFSILPAKSQEADIVYRANRWTYDSNGRGRSVDISSQIRPLFRYQFTLSGYEPPNEIILFSQGRVRVPLLVFEFDIYSEGRVVFWVRSAMARQTVPQQYYFMNIAARGYGHESQMDSLIRDAAHQTLRFLGVYGDNEFAIVGGVYHRSGIVQAIMPRGTVVEWINSMGETVSVSNLGATGATAYLRKGGVYFVFATNTETGVRSSYRIVVMN